MEDSSEKKPIICGLDYLRQKGWQPVIRHRAGAQRIADRMANKSSLRNAKGFVCDTPNGYRVTVGSKA